MPAKVGHQEGTVYNPMLLNGTDAQLQKLLMTGVVIAGKVARIQQEKLDEFLLQLRNHLVAHKIPGTLRNLPFGLVAGVLTERYGQLRLEQIMKNVKLGKYTLLSQSFCTMTKLWKSNELDLRACTREDLCKIPGVGMKTASFFILFTRPGVRMCCLDTHILQYMAEHKLADKIPRQPRSEADYLRLEQAFLKYCDEKHPNESVADVDFNIWLERNVGDKQKIKEPDPNACHMCGGPADNGEGWDGLCGNCADREARRKGEI
jgi:hypothetical protein